MYSMSKEINYYYYFNLRSNAGINCINCNASDSFVPNVRKCIKVGCCDNWSKSKSDLWAPPEVLSGPI